MATGIIKQSSNISANKYCKMPDGTLICYGTVKFPGSTETGEQTVTDNFIIPFVINPYVVISWQDTVLTRAYFDYLGCLPSETTTTQMTAIANRIQASASNWYASYIAIGRWK